MEEKKVVTSETASEHTSTVLLQLGTLGLGPEAEARVSAAAMTSVLKELAGMDSGFKGIVYVGDMKPSPIVASGIRAEIFDRKKWYGGMIMKFIREQPGMLPEVNIQEQLDRAFVESFGKR